MGLHVYHAELAEAQADPALARLLARSDTSVPFDRIEWLQLMAQECLPARDCFLAVAREGDAVAVLPLAPAARGLGPLGNWYSFFVRPQVNADAPHLLRALAASLARHGAIELSPMPEDAARALAQAFRDTGWLGRVEPCDTNHHLALNGRSFAEYWSTRPGALRETVRRKGRKGVVALRIATRFDPADWAAYEAIYARSWKPGEGSPAFLRRFAEMEGAAGALRIGLAEIDGQAVAAQFWTVEGGTAWIHKLAHDERAGAHSPGTLLSAALFEHVIDRDRVHTVDFGTGNDPYKRDWMESVRARFRLRFYRPGAIRHWPALARMTVRSILPTQSLPTSSLASPSPAG